MLNWFRKAERIYGDLSFLKVDMHSHLIPGVDDGAQTLEESLHFIDRLRQLGIMGMITTPHIFSDLYPNTKESIEAPFLKIKQHLPGLFLEYAAEYMINPEFEGILAAKDLLTFGGDHVLIEQSYLGSSPNFFDMIFQLKVNGYQPVLAHPERYVFWHKEKGIFQDLKDRGCLLQLNLLSITGYYGAEVKNVALKLLSEGLYDLAGTDLHHERHLNALTELTRSKMLSLLAMYDFKNASLLPTKV